MLEAKTFLERTQKENKLCKEYDFSSAGIRQAISRVIGDDTILKNIPERVLKDIPYYEQDAPKCGNTEYLEERCKLDLFLPAGRENFPVLIWFHGGGLTSGYKYLPENINVEEIGVAAVEYRLSGDRAECPDYIYDAAAAIAWVVKHIREYGGDPSMIYVAGCSAGAYLITMNAMDPKYLATFGITPHDVKTWFSITGQMTTHFQIIAEYEKKNPDRPKHVMELDEYAPLLAARRDAPELILYVGDSDRDIPTRAEENFLMESTLRRLHGDNKVRCYTFPTCDHQTVTRISWLLVANRIMQDQQERAAR